MKSKSLIFGTLVLVFAVGAALIYANADAVESVLAAVNTHVHRMLGAHPHIRHAAERLKLIGCFRPNPTGTVSRAGEL